MTTQPLFVGVEQEFQLMKKNEYQQFSEVWERRERKYSSPLYHKSGTSVRTHVGSAMYADGCEPEICTPPIRVEKGFVTQAADALYLSRKVLVDFIRSENDLDVIGYSTHWNCTDRAGFSDVCRRKMMRALGVPFSMFTLNPLSVGTNLRRKPQRLELLGDYLDNEDQVRAFLLLYAGSVAGYQRVEGSNAERFPLSLNPQRYLAEFGGGDARIANLVQDGRTSQITVQLRDRKLQEITAQTYLEIIYRYLKDSIAEIATKDDIHNLEDFISGRKKLEIDNIEKYGFTSFYKGKYQQALGLQYHPSFCLRREDYGEEREVPKGLARFLGSMADGKILGRFEIRSMNWDAIRFYDTKNEVDLRLGNNLFEIDKTAELLASFPKEQQAAVLSARLNNSARTVLKELTEVGITTDDLAARVAEIERTIELHSPRGKEGANLGDIQKLISREEKKTQKRFPEKHITEKMIEQSIQIQRQDFSLNIALQEGWKAYCRQPLRLLRDTAIGIAAAGLIGVHTLLHARHEYPLLLPPLIPQPSQTTTAPPSEQNYSIQSPQQCFINERGEQ